MREYRKYWPLPYIIDFILACIILYIFVPHTRPGFWPLGGCTIGVWGGETHYIAAWNRDLTVSEVDELIQGISRQGFGDVRKINHLIHHGKETLVSQALLDASMTDNPMLSITGEFILFRIGDNPDTRFAYLMDVLKTGGLNEEDHNLLYIAEGLSVNHSSAPWDKRRHAIRLRHRDKELLEWYLNPEQDAERIPDLIALLEEDDEFVRNTAVNCLAHFKNDETVMATLEEVAENDPDEDVRRRAQIWLVEDPNRPSYEEYVLKNRRGYAISMWLIGIIVLFTLALEFRPRRRKQQKQ